MGYTMAILAIVLVIGFLVAQRRGTTAADNTPELSSRKITTPRHQLSYPDGTAPDVSSDRERNRWGAIHFVRGILENRSRYVILDTETTGLGKTDEIVQLAVIDLDGNVLFNENIKPTRKKRMSQEAVAIHGLTMKALSTCRTFAELAESLERAIGGKTVIAYNALFDGRMYAQTLKLAGGYLYRGDWADLMDEYARYVGEWDDYHQNYRWQPLPGGTHSALGDCQATLELLRKMAATNS